MSNNHPFDHIFLKSNIELHEYLFHIFVKNEEYNHFSFFSLVDEYMQTSNVRAKMDIGNLIALNTGSKGLLYSVDWSKCAKRSDIETEIDYDKAIWMARVYFTLQWESNIPSAVINKRIPAKELYSMYEKYCSRSIQGVCKVLYRDFLHDIDKKIEKESDDKEIE